MITPKSLLGFILIKRYSLLDVVLSIIVLTAVTVVSAKEYGSQLAKTLLAQSQLPAVQLPDVATPPEADVYSKDYNFTSDWFTHNIPVWDKALAPFKGKSGIQYLEVGLFEGRATMWMIENILTHPTSRLTGMDLFAGDHENQHGSFKETYLANLQLSGAADRATTIQGNSQVELRKLPLESCDIVYIDGSHLNADVLEDAVLCWRLLKDGGVLIFDDYGGGAANPKLGIDTFVRYYGDHFDVVHNSIQLVLRKKNHRESLAESKG